MTHLATIVGAIVLLCSAMAPVSAQERDTIGIGRVFTNDIIGDGEDRWRTGGYQLSIFRGPEWTGALPSSFGEVVEFRLRGEVIAPDNLVSPMPGDRLFVGAWWAGVHTHFNWSGFDIAAGADIAVLGEQTGLRDLQEDIHDILSLPDPNVRDFQVDNDIFLHGTIEVARDIPFPIGRMRPFVELQAGVEDIVRAGADITIGRLGEGGIRMRDPITGQRIAAVRGEASGWSGLFGGDYAYVGSSAYFPSSGPDLEDTRARLRAGINFGFGQSNLFYGVTYLSEEFEGQPSGQVVGSLSLNIRF